MLSNYPFLDFKEANSFAHHTFTHRIPWIINQVLETNDFNKTIVGKLEEIQKNPLHTKVDSSISTNDTFWRDFYEKYDEKRLSELGFFHAEMYFYELINSLVDYERTHLDVFEPIKISDLQKNESQILPILSKAKELTVRDSIFLALHGNMADLSQNSMSRDKNPTLLIDDSRELSTIVTSAKKVHLLLDNSGLELLSDLILAQSIVKGNKSQVILHYKSKPIFVSDTLDGDITQLLTFCESLGFDNWVNEIRELIHKKRISLIPNNFWNSPNFFTEMTDTIKSQFEAYDVIISKGDANYRRFFEDRKIPHDIDPSILTSYLPCPTFCIRTLKSEIQLGLTDDQIASLSSNQPNWLFNGKNAVIQKIS